MAILYLLPNRDGVLSQWTQFGGMSAAHWDNVDDPVGSPDEDAEYIYTDVLNVIDDFHHATSALLTGATITNVRVTARARATTMFFTTINIGIKIGITRYAGATDDNLGMGYWDYSQDWAFKPPGVTRWTKADIDDLQSSIEMLADAITARVTQVYLTITYTPAPPEITPVAGKGLVSWTP